MRIVVCIKQVPDAKDVRLDPETNTLSREGVKSVINPYDRHAMEEGVRLKEQYGGTVTVVSMGPPQAKAILSEAISCGVDDAILVSDRAFAGADTLATTYTLAQAIKKTGDVDLVLCGKQATDGDTAQVGPGLAVRLDMPYVTCVKKVHGVKDQVITLERMMDDGHDELEVELPALLTVVKEINVPRFPSIRGLRKAKAFDIPSYTAADINADPDQLGLGGSPTQVVKVFPPEPKGERTMLEGSLEEIAEKLAEILSDSAHGA